MQKGVRGTMRYKNWHGLCLCCEQEYFPEDARDVDAPFTPLVFLVKRDPHHSRGLFAIRELAELYEGESVRLLAPCPAGGEAADSELAQLVHAHGASVLNVAFGRAFTYLRSFMDRPKDSLKVTLAGLGDVGGTVLTGLTLLGREIREIAVYDPHDAMCQRYELEMNQIIPTDTGRAMPRITICPQEQLFDCDVFLFAASRGVPGLNSAAQDVRMAQYDANRDMLREYAQQARAAQFMGLICQIADPVDHLCRGIFLQSNQNEDGSYDWNGLLPEQIQGFGLGVMAGRAAYYADKKAIAFDNGRLYGPHGAGLIVANDPCDAYDDALSCQLTEWTRRANMRVRELGFKPYIAPGLSSAAISVLQYLRGEMHYGAVPIDGAYFGCTNRISGQGLLLRRERICPPLMNRIKQSHATLKEFDYE